MSDTPPPDRLDQLRKLHDADPSDPFCTYGIAMELIKRDESEQAMAWLDKTLALDADYCYAYFQKAKLLTARGDRAAALAVIDAGIEQASKLGDQKARDELRSLREMAG